MKEYNYSLVWFSNFEIYLVIIEVNYSLILKSLLVFFSAESLLFGRASGQ